MGRDRPPPQRASSPSCAVHFPEADTRNCPADAAIRLRRNKQPIRSFTSRSEDAQSSSVVSVDAPTGHDPPNHDCPWIQRVQVKRNCNAKGLSGYPPGILHQTEKWVPHLRGYAASCGMTGWLAALSSRKSRADYPVPTWNSASDGEVGPASPRLRRCVRDDRVACSDGSRRWAIFTINQYC